MREKLAEGGMAEIYLATAVGAEGFAKDVVIKVVRPYLSSDQQFVQMFIAEARLASRLNHANIVQIFDFGQHDERYFLAMEYVRGASLWDLRKRCRELGVPFPPTLAAEICAQVARGLQYAHTLSEGGRRLGVVHRDVTPHNVLLSFDGAVKLTDFGIAKATTSQTAPGMLKGKFAYMSPEQSRGDRVDARTDVFALGIVLWELLTGGRLFDGDSDLAVLRAVQDSLIAPPSRLNPDVPQALSEVVMKALSRPVEERFQSAAEAERALATFVLRSAETVEDTSVARFLQAIFRDEHQLDAPLDSDAALQPAPELSPMAGGIGDGDTLFLRRRKAQGTMTQTPVSPLPQRATPRPIKAGHVADGGVDDPAISGSARRTTPLRGHGKGAEGNGSMGGVALGARTTEPLPRRGKEGTNQMPTSRRGASGARPFGRLSVGERSKAEASEPGDGEEPWSKEPSPSAHKRRLVALLVVGGMAALGVVGGAIAFALWPSDSPPALAAASRASETPQDEPAAPLEHPLHEPPPVPEVAPPVVDAEQPAQAPVTGRLESPTPAREEPTEPPAGTGPSMRAVEPPSRVPTRMGRLVVKAVPYAVVTEGGKPLGEVLGHRVFSLRPGTYEIELIHPQRRQRQSITIRANEDSRVEFSAIE